MSAYDLAVVGGGPAGVAGALTAAQAGLRVALLDAAPRLGGQYFRRLPETFHATREAALHHGLDRFLRQSRALRSLADVLLEHRVWAVERHGGLGDFVVHAVAGDREERPVTVRASALLIATGAHDRPLPFPGWDLPGVLTAGGAQALLKGNLVVAGRRVVVAGTGPFPLPVAAGLARAGARVVEVLEANGPLGLARHPALAASKLGEAAGYALALARHRVPYRARQAVVAAHGDGELTHVTVGRLDRDWRVVATRTVECDTLAVGYGFVPQVELAVQAGCAMGHDLDGSPVVSVDAAQRTSVAGVYAAGEPTGVGGAELAEVEGRIAGHAAAADLRSAVHLAAEPPGTAVHRPAEPPGTPAHWAAGPAGLAVPEPLLRRRARLRAFAQALHRAYPVRPGWRDWLTPATLVCRCEEVPYEAVREAMDLGATDARSVKLLARPGMGWCQGRMCGYAVACLAGELPQAPRRPIAQPITLGSLERMTDDPS
ncbi:NAD(P)/FAD-dependent oxidoreductase [Thermoactinospora rubra]|uniref:FAD/NAD(P)-dependent oxidoreductase n=1 Tax=Thermoactinospora rubra TaxID=1088767 RepID=UPI000A11EA8D|nr:NAD(P)/FAD-dependent oxidoreductase [Thermoactinospora rubra]